MSYRNEYDVEKNGAYTTDASPYDYEKRGGYADDGHAVSGETFAIGDSWNAKIQRIAGKFHVEQRGIERVPEDERTDKGFKALLNVSTMWLSANMVVSSFAIGIVGPLLDLGAADSMLTVLFFNLLGITPVCFFSTFGPVFGLRQMVLSRFWFGWWTVKLVAIFNVLACIGWSSVNAIVGAQLINTVNSDVPGYAGILIIAFCTLLVTLFGYKVVHAYEFWSWIPATIIFFIVLGVFAHSGDFYDIPWSVGDAEMGHVFAFGAVVYGFATGWTSYAADYTCYQPPTQSKLKVFFWTWLGLIVPLLFTEMLGVAVMSAAFANDQNNRYWDGFLASNTGGLLGAVLIYHLGTFGKFCLVVLALTIIANNCPNLYSVALTVQVLSHYFAMVPRYIWTTIATGVYIGIAIPGYSHFIDVLEDFMYFIGYWLAIYEGISLTDHFVFKRGFAGYVVQHYDQPNKLPVGLSAFFAFCCGVVGMVMGMSQKWYTGPIAKHVGVEPIYGDVGFECAFAFAVVGYLASRPIELRYFGR